MVVLGSIVLALAGHSERATATEPLTPPANDEQPPNVVLMIADDMAYHDCGPMGHPHIKTPNLDRLASEGMTFDQVFLTCSSCSPSRASMITCRYPHLTDAEQLHWPLPEEQQTFVELLTEAGYYTAASGKWHLGQPTKDDFSLVDEASTSGFQLQTDDRGQAIAMSDENNASGCANWVRVLSERPEDRPFFMWFAALDPHRDYAPNTIPQPHQPEDVVLPPFIPDTLEVRKDFAMYYDEISRLDFYVGAVLDELERQGVADNTVVMFTSDNGRPFPRCKTTILDSGIRTPLIVRWPGQVPEATRTDALISSIDFGTTILEITGLEPAERMLGRSFLAVLKEPQSPHREFIFAEHNWHDFDAYQRGVRTDRFKYIRNFDHELTLSPPADAVRSPTFRAMLELKEKGQLSSHHWQCFEQPRAEEELYDLKNDPDELVNVAKNPQYRETLERLRRELQRWREETRDAELTVRAPDEFDRITGEPLENRKRPRNSKAEFREMQEARAR
jgi:N-sulfoglucosamine sulfohydrolase